MNQLESRNMLRPSKAELEKEQTQHKKHHKARVIVSKQMINEAEQLGLPLKDYLKLLHKSSKNQIQQDIIPLSSIQHYLQQQQRKLRQQKKQKLSFSNKKENDEDFLDLQNLTGYEERIDKLNEEPSALGAALNIDETRLSTNTSHIKQVKLHKRAKAYKPQEKITVHMEDINLDNTREKASEFERNFKEKIKMSFNQKFTIFMLFAFHFFNIVCIINEFAFFMQSECASLKPKHLPVVHFDLDVAHEDYIQNQAYSFLGILLSITATILVVYLTFKDVQDPQNKISKRNNIICKRMRKPYWLSLFIIGIIPCLLMPVYTFDYFTCQNRNNIFTTGGYPVYFNEFLVVTAVILIFLSLALKFVIQKNLFQITQAFKKKANNMRQYNRQIDKGPQQTQKTMIDNNNELSQNTKTYSNMTQANFNGIDSIRFNMMSDKESQKDIKVDEIHDTHQPSPLKIQETQAIKMQNEEQHSVPLKFRAFHIIEQLIIIGIMLLNFIGFLISVGSFSNDQPVPNLIINFMIWIQYLLFAIVQVGKYL
ncbi:UNKNOWN [Stylonychia lemnae]|uniref:Transmembrane protein n=1 Tax=Stylonychia lemnae TaxID=5949 RepID=A0A078A572_STYLE|nr:UNKNOWN [Stylonychia lemnae]|eukprot:CDW77029.1 UNKNOWN [Stylonychia lemnae]